VNRKPGVTWRAVLLGLVLVPLNCLWITVIEVRWYNLDGSCLPLFVTPVFLLFVATVGNIALHRLRARWALGQGELLTAYIMAVVSSTVAGHDTLQNMFGAITHPAWYDHLRPERHWPAVFFSLLPKWLFVWDMPALKEFYQGNADPYLWRNLAPWVVPLAWWALFFTVMVGMMLCLNVLLRRAWTEQEKLAYPIIQLPLAMTEGGTGGPLFGSRLMWLGFAVAAGLVILNGLWFYYPNLPYLKIKHNEVRYEFRTYPWTAGGNLPFDFYPFAVGLAYFVPLDLLFSCWFFFLFRKVEAVGGAMAGWDRMQDFPYINEQASGAWIGLALVALYALRQPLRHALRVALGRVPADDEREPMRYRWALAGLAAGALFLLVFWGAAGMSAWAVVVIFAIYFLLAIAITRVRAELGSPHEIYFVNPANIMVRALGTDFIGPRNLAGISVTHWMNRCYRNHPMPNQLEAFKMAEVTGMNARRVALVLMLATVVAIGATYWVSLWQGYRDGALAKSEGFKWWAGSESFDRLQTWLETQDVVEGNRRLAMLAGMGVVFLLRSLRSTYVAWPFHPAGYALGVSFAMDYFWFAFFLGWLIKGVLIRYGGMHMHRRAIPFFLGLILGHYVTGSIWALICPLSGHDAYRIFI